MRAFWFIVSLAVGTVGCRTNEDRCREYCEWLDECAGDANCTDEAVEDCAESIDEAGGECENDFDEFLECVEENPDCGDGMRACGDEFLLADSSCDTSVAEP